MASDFALKVPAELESALGLNAAQNYITKTPWLDRYGINVRPIAPIGSSSRKVQVDSSILHRCLPDELLFEEYLYPYRNRRMGVHLVCYYRYMRLFPSGRFLYKNSSQKLKDVAKYMNFRGARADYVFSGHYTLSDDKARLKLQFCIQECILHSYCVESPTEALQQLAWSQLRGTLTGANNRMDLLSLVTSGVNNKEVSGPDEDILGVVEGWQDDETHNPDVPPVSHKRGLTPFVLAPFEEVEASFLNLPAEKMDYFVPG